MPAFILPLHMDLKKLITPGAGFVNLLTLVMPWLGAHMEVAPNSPAERGYRFLSHGGFWGMVLMVLFIIASLLLMLLSLLPLPFKRVFLLFFSVVCFFSVAVSQIYFEYHLTHMFNDSTSRIEIFAGYGWYVALLFSFVAFVGAWVYPLTKHVNVDGD